MKEITKHKYYELGKTILGLVLIAGSLGYLTVKYIETNEMKTLVQSLYSKQTPLYAEIYVDRAKLSRELDRLRAGNESLKGEVTAMTSVVQDLKKIVETDKELLVKYSKIYFLNENYEPKELSYLEFEFTNDKTRQYQVHSKVYPFLNRMLIDAKAAGLNLLVSSAFRSFKEQSGLKAGYRMTYGTTVANKFSADQGYSEHQLGTTLDFTTPKVGGLSTSFESTDEYKWLTANAYKYGFILSYPPNNAYYVYEPWHWRFVGVELATYMYSENKRFYDMDQRDINEYLGKIFEHYAN